MSESKLTAAETEALRQIAALQSRVAELEKEIAELKAAPRFVTFSPPLWTKATPVIDVETLPSPPAPPFFGDPPNGPTFICCQPVTQGKNIVDTQNQICDYPADE